MIEVELEIRSDQNTSSGDKWDTRSISLAFLELPLPLKDVSQAIQTIIIALHPEPLLLLALLSRTLMLKHDGVKSNSLSSMIPLNRSLLSSQINHNTIGISWTHSWVPVFRHGIKPTETV